ncbi:MAG TPA: GlsB/YeaQ/YmgE family stress response membrane protein [Anaerolineales bacterium]|nr:GlsB/YeaQ/YmgE family stress response membrane protein [Anaerolineales bacterium]
MSIILWIVVGIIAGWLAGKIMKGKGFGLIGDLVVGVIGAFLGGWLFGLLHISIGAGIIGSLITALVGALVLLFVIRLIFK